MQMLPEKRGGPDYRDEKETRRDDLNEATRKSKVSRREDAARRNGLQLAAMAMLDHELPELQEDIKAVMHKCRFSNPKATGDRDLKLITWRNKECGLCYDADKCARFITSESAANEGEDLCPHAFCWDCACSHVFGAAAINARTVQYHAAPPARCPFCGVEVTDVVRVEFLADSGI